MKNEICLLRMPAKILISEVLPLFFAFLLIVFYPLKSESQVISLPENANFYDYLESFYNSDRYDPTDDSEGGPKVAHERLSHVWGKRLHPHGDFSIANRAIINYAETYTPVNNQIENPNWICIGPSNDPINSTSHGVGQIHRITFNPNYGISNQTVYACTGFGGLWRSENDGTSWEVVNTDGLPVSVQTNSDTF